jgi:hypothetical protein
MFDFFIKKKPLVLDCFTYSSHAYDYAKIDDASKYIPDWWKNTPKINEKTQEATIKSCHGFTEFFNRGIVIPSWFELELKIENKELKTWQWNCSSSDFTTSDSHTNSQFDFFANEFGHNIKITSPWLFKMKENIQFVWSQPTWNMRNNLFKMSILPGVINFKTQYATHINYLVENKDYEQICLIEPMTPLVILHALTEKNIVIKNHLISSEEFIRQRDGIHNLLLFRNAEDVRLKRKKIEKLQNKLNDINSKKSKCPFGFK